MSQPPEIHDAAIAAMLADPAGPVGKVITEKTLKVEGVIKSLLLIPGSGRTYTTTFWRDHLGRLRRGRPRAPHTASAPGMPPASDTGQLLNSIEHEIVVEEGVVKGKVEANKKYALFLEHGTRYMAPRPFMKPGLDMGMKL